MLILEDDGRNSQEGDVSLQRKTQTEVKQAAFMRNRDPSIFLVHPCKQQTNKIPMKKDLEKLGPYHAEMNEQNSGVNWSAGAEGGSPSTMASISS
uniref:Uncharacterized protein n=1 Tax=Cucumis melo TaxID=3656 RepID=A0A9I9E6D1_CUCME